VTGRIWSLEPVRWDRKSLFVEVDSNGTRKNTGLVGIVMKKSTQMCIIEPLPGNWCDFVDICNMLAEIGSRPRIPRVWTDVVGTHVSLGSPLPD
jgi:hypothetical protein